MMLDYDPSTINSILGSAMSLVYNAAIALGLTAIIMIFLPWAYNSWKKYNTKSYDISLIEAIKYVISESVYSDSIEKMGLNDSDDIITDTFLEQARLGKIRVLGRRVRSTSMTIIPKIAWQGNVYIHLFLDEEKSSASLEDRNSDETLYCGLLVDKNEILKLWPPKKEYKYNHRLYR